MQGDEISVCGSGLGWGRLNGYIAQREDQCRQEN